VLRLIVRQRLSATEAATVPAVTILAVGQALDLQDDVDAMEARG